MRKLLSAGFYRLFRHPAYLVILLVLAVLGGAMCGADLYYGMDDVHILPMLFAFGATIALAWGREHGDGAVRNKVVAGNGRGAIFLSETLLHMTLCVVLALCFLAAMLIAGHKVIAQIPGGIVVKVCLCFLLSAAGMSAFLSGVCALIFNRAICAIVGVLLVLGLQFATYQLQDLLNQPSTYTIEHMDENNQIVAVEEIPNRLYIKEPWRSICTHVDCANPFGQMSRSVSVLNSYAYHLGEGKDFGFEWDNEDEKRVEILHTLPAYAVGSTVLVTGVGYLLFRRKDLK